MNKTLVFGASLNTEKYSNMALHRLKNADENVVAFGIKEGTIAGVPIDTVLKQYSNIDTVTLYINPKTQQQYYDYIISLKPKRVIFNPGTENPEFYSLLKDNHIAYEVACTLVLLATNQY
jgi:predicted CoA-binding protein